MTILEKLRAVTTVVADSGDITAIRDYAPEDATTNPSLILKAAAQPLYRPLIEQAVTWAREQGGSKEMQLNNASDKLAVNIGLELLRLVPGIRQRVMHITLEGDLVSRVKTDSAAQLDNRSHVSVVPELPGAVHTMAFE